MMAGGLPTSRSPTPRVRLCAEASAAKVAQAGSHLGKPGGIIMKCSDLTCLGYRAVLDLESVGEPM